MEFPRLMFRAPGAQQCQGGSYDHKLVQDEEEFSAGLSDGYHGTLPEALAPAPVIITAKLAEPDDNALPTSDELRAKAAELGIKVHHKANDATVLAAITAKLAEA
jgi:hypothetical protein